MAGFTKLHSKIVYSSVWREPMHVRIVWITMLALANQDGVVEGAANGLAHLAGVTIDEFQDAIGVLCGPDPHSSDGTTGERVEKVPGGWFIINHANYRDVRTREQIKTAERVRKHRERQRESLEDCVTVTGVTVGNAVKRRSASASASESAAVAGTEPDGLAVPSKPKTKVERPDDVPEQVWDDWLALRRAKKAPCSKTALTRFRSEASKAGLSLSEAMEIAVQNGWQGFQAAWVANRGANGQKINPITHSLPPGSYGTLEDYDDDGWGDTVAKMLEEDRKNGTNA